MTSLDMLNAELTAIQEQLTPLERKLDKIKTKVKPLQQSTRVKQKAVRQYMETNKIQELEVCGIQYVLEDVTDVKCTIDRMRATLPADVVEQYVQANTVTETKFRKIKLPPPENSEDH